MVLLLGLLLPFLFLLILYLLGPKPEEPIFDLTLPQLKEHLFEIAEDIDQQEQSTKNIRPDNEARIIWAQLQAEKTEYSVVYLHGFSASQGDGAPVHTEFAAHFGYNIYLPRLQAHGLSSEEPLLDFDHEKFMKSAVEAYAIGKRIGEKVILMGSSTGASLALYLAAHFPDIHSLILLSPNIELFDKKTKLLDKPWGLQIARTVLQDRYKRSTSDPEKKSTYWDEHYRLEAAVLLKSLIKHTMKPEIFAQIHQPCFVGYYYKNEIEQDQTVSVAHTKLMFDQLGTKDSDKYLQNFPEAGDHCIGSSIWSNSWELVRDATIKFGKEYLKLKPEQ